jgi:hypothetical protein
MLEQMVSHVSPKIGHRQMQHAGRNCTGFFQLAIAPWQIYPWNSSAFLVGTWRSGVCSNVELFHRKMDADLPGVILCSPEGKQYLV